MRNLLKRCKYPDTAQAVVQYIPTWSGVEVVISPIHTARWVARLYVRRRSDAVMETQTGEDQRRWIIDWYNGPREIPYYNAP